MNSIYQLFFAISIVAFVIGLLLYFKIPLFKLPGDISYSKDGFSFYFPITTGIVISTLITIVLNIFRK